MTLAAAASLAAEPPVPFSKSVYPAIAQEKAVVLVSVAWARQWKCGAFQNAQLQSLGFDLASSIKSVPTEAPDLSLEDSSLLPASPGFKNYAYIVAPGEYLFSAYKIKAAKSISQVGFFASDRSTLISDGKSKAGSFTVAAGEIVYIGHFALDCASAPMPWRFYPEDRPAFNKYLESVAPEFPGLPTEQVKFRLFETELIGKPFTLQ